MPGPPVSSSFAERFFNWQSDQNWAWGLFLPLRPPPESPMRPWVWVRLFFVFTTLGLILIALTALAAAGLPRLAASQHQSLPSSLTETLETLRAMGADSATRSLLLALLLALPPLFFAFCLPYHWAWNRRAARLQTREKARPPEAAQAGVWPPAPKTKL